MEALFPSGTLMPEKNLKGTWSQALLSLFLPIFLIMFVRWALIETFVIPSSSMVPNLLIHDHIFVTKFDYGLKVPFSNQWMLKINPPKRGEVIVFKYPENPDVYYVKRLVGLPGDKIELQGLQLKINGVPTPIDSVPPVSGLQDSESFDYFLEKMGEKSHLVRYFKNKENIQTESFEVPPGHYFMMGDNRDQSSDSRYWGFVPDENLVGKVRRIWLSCEETLPSNTMICDPSKIRMERFFKKVE